MTGRIGLPDVQRDEGDNPPYVARHCLLCKRPLDVPGVPDSLDCGGDCWGCIRVIEAEMEDPDLVEPRRVENFLVQAWAAHEVMEKIMEEHEVMEVAAKYARPADPNADIVGATIPGLLQVSGTAAWSDGMYVAVTMADGSKSCRLASHARAALARQNDLPYTEGRKGGTT